jgi:hypothetical protein
MKLSKNFTLDEFVTSETAARNGIDNTPNEDVVDNLKWLCSVAEDVRELLDVPIIVLSGYRCPKLNTLLKGAKNSQHVTGLAMDFIAPAYGTPFEIARAISASGLQYDQLIHEFGQWVHLSVSETPRKEDLTIFKAGGYRRGIIEKAD